MNQRNNPSNAKRGIAVQLDYCSAAKNNCSTMRCHSVRQQQQYNTCQTTRNCGATVRSLHTVCSSLSQAGTQEPRSLRECQPLTVWHGRGSWRACDPVGAAMCPCCFCKSCSIPTAHTTFGQSLHNNVQEPSTRCITPAGRLMPHDIPPPPSSCP
jgi:hypothetical protein